MSALTRNDDQTARRLAAQRVRSAGRSRRAGAGTITEMARSLVRDAREAGAAEARSLRDEAARADAAVRQACSGAPARSGKPMRLSSRPFAARRA